MNEQFDGMNKIYQVDLPLSHGESFILQVINKDSQSISIRINDGAIFALRTPRSLRGLNIDDKANGQYIEYDSANKLYAKIKILYKLRK